METPVMVIGGSEGAQRAGGGNRRAMEASGTPHPLFGPLIERGIKREGEGGYRRAEEVAEREPEGYQVATLAAGWWKSLPWRHFYRMGVTALHHVLF